MTTLKDSEEERRAAESMQSEGLRNEEVKQINLGELTQMRVTFGSSLNKGENIAPQQTQSNISSQ